MTGTNRLTARAAVERLADGQITCVDLAGDCLERIAEREPVVGAWESLDSEGVMAAARRLDAAPRQGPLHGLPVAVKDIIDTAGMPTEYGTPIYRGHRPSADADCVARTHAAGALILGKTVTTEFADWNPGKTANPFDPRRTPGGSSSGSAAAVADFMVPLAFGTQTGGSVNRPASFCGIVGFKPTFGVHGMAGCKTIAASLDTLGFLARTVADVALFADALRGGPPTDLELDRPPRLGLWRTPWWDRATPAAADALGRAEAALRGTGCPVAEVEMPPNFADLLPLQILIYQYERARALAPERDRYGAMISPLLRAAIADGLDIPETRYRQALAAAAELRSVFDAAFEDIDALFAPGALGEAPMGLESTGDPLFSKAFTVLHGPCVTVPAGLGPAGLPIGVQVAGPRGGDGPTLAAAAALERALT